MSDTARCNCQLMLTSSEGKKNQFSCFGAVEKGLKGQVCGIEALNI